MTLSIGLIGIMLFGIAGLVAIAVREQSCGKPESDRECKAEPEQSTDCGGLPEDMAATPPHKDRMMDAYQPSAELIHACALLMDRLKAGDPETLLKEDLQHVARWLDGEPTHAIPESARYHSD